MITIAYECGCREEANADLKSAAKCPMHGASVRRAHGFAASEEALVLAFGARTPAPRGPLFYPCIPGMKTWRV